MADVSCRFGTSSGKRFRVGYHEGSFGWSGPVSIASVMQVRRIVRRLAQPFGAWHQTRASVTFADHDRTIRQVVHPSH